MPINQIFAASYCRASITTSAFFALSNAQRVLAPAKALRCAHKILPGAARS